MPRQAFLARVRKRPATRIIVAASREYKSLRLSSKVGAHVGPHLVDSLRGDGLQVLHALYVEQQTDPAPCWQNAQPTVRMINQMPARRNTGGKRLFVERLIEIAPPCSDPLHVVRLPISVGGSDSHLLVQWGKQRVECWVVPKRDGKFQVASEPYRGHSIRRPRIWRHVCTERLRRQGSLFQFLLSGGASGLFGIQTPL